MVGLVVGIIRSVVVSLAVVGEGFDDMPLVHIYVIANPM